MTRSRVPDRLRRSPWCTRPAPPRAKPLAAVLVLVAAIGTASRPAVPAMAGTEPGAICVFLPMAMRSCDLALRPPPATAVAPEAPTATPTDGPQATPTTAPAPDIATAHYDLHVEGMDPAEAGRLLEQLHGDLAAHFGRAPAGRLRGGIYASLDAMRLAMTADGETYRGGGGYYSPATRAFYLFVQPSEYFTRQLALHEATHQFHFLLLAEDGSPGPAGTWYVEGLAEHFGMHNWDGQNLATGVVPAVSLEDYPAAALAHLDGHDGDLASLVADGPGWDRPDAWALVSFLFDARAPTARDLFSRLDRGQDPTAAWRAVLGPVTQATSAEYRAWLAAHQQPWREIWRSWQERGDRLEGKSDVVTIAVLKDAPARLAAELHPLVRPVGAGLVFGFRSTDDFHMVQLRADRQVWVLRRQGGGWQFVGRAHAGTVAGADLLAVHLSGDGVEASVNGTAVFSGAAPGLVGLNVEGGSALFAVTIDP